MLLNPHDWSLAQQIDRVLPAARRRARMRDHVTRETHSSALELGTGVHQTAGALRRRAALRCAPRSTASWRRSGCARRAPAPTPRRSGTRRSCRAARATRRSTARCASWRGASRPSACTSTSACATRRTGSGCSTGCASTCRCCSRCRSTRRSGRGATPAWRRRARRCSRRSRASASRAPSATTRTGSSAVDLLIRCDAFPEPTFLWWDVRPQPRFGTVEVRVLDAQTTASETAALAALVQCIARLEVEEGYVPAALVGGQEALEENRFIAARDGMDARLIDPVGRAPDPGQGDCSTACWRPARRMPSRSTASVSWR